MSIKSSTQCNSTTLPHLLPIPRPPCYSHPQCHSLLLCRLLPILNLNFQDDIHWIYALVLYTSNIYLVQALHRDCLTVQVVAAAQMVVVLTVIVPDTSPCFLFVFNRNTVWSILHASELRLLNSRYITFFFQLFCPNNHYTHIPNYVYNLILQLLFQSIEIICNCPKLQLIHVIPCVQMIKFLRIFINTTISLPVIVLLHVQLLLIICRQEILFYHALHSRL